MDQPIHKRVDESWKEQVEREKTVAPPSGPPSIPPGGPPSSPRAPREQVQGPQPREEDDAQLPEARFDVFVSGLGMEALIALGDIPHPVTRKQAANAPHAKYLIDVLGILEEKTKGNLSVEEGRLLSDTVYQLRMRYLAKRPGGAVAP